METVFYAITIEVNRPPAEELNDPPYEPKRLQYILSETDTFRLEAMIDHYQNSPDLLQWDRWDCDERAVFRDANPYISTTLVLRPHGLSLVEKDALQGFVPPPHYLR